MELLSRAAAIKENRRHYFTGKPCRHGHIDVRFTSIGKCKSCAREEAARIFVPKTGKRRTVLDTATFIAKATAVHGGKYTYDRAHFVAAKKPITITCLVHGDFETRPDTHLQGKGCSKCAAQRVSARCAKGLAQFVVEATTVWGPRYDYGAVVYVGAKTPVTIRCAAHGTEFVQTPNGHLRRKHGCAQCEFDARSVAQAKPEAQFWQDALNVWGPGKYEYGAVRYQGHKKPIQVRCLEHDVVFTQTAGSHLRGHVGCPKCNCMRSAGEEAVARFLSVLTPVQRRDRVLVAPKELDIFLPAKQLAVEYCGEYWHSHGDADSEAANALRHYHKYNACATQGIRLLTIFESEWLEHGYAIRRLLRNVIGKSRGRLMARKCDLHRVALQEARAFFAKYHPQGGAGHGEHYGLYWNGKLVACMRFAEGVNDRGVGKRRVWTLARFATRVTVAGAASRLFCAFVKEFSPKEVKSFSDDRYFSGGMYAQLGFLLTDTSKPDYQVWHHKLGLRPKAAWQRRNLPRIAAEIGIPLEFAPDSDPRTEQDITYLLGGRRIYDCGKKKWVWTPKN